MKLYHSDNIDFYRHEDAFAQNKDINLSLTNATLLKKSGGQTSAQEANTFFVSDLEVLGMKKEAARKVKLRALYQTRPLKKVPGQEDLS